MAKAYVATRYTDIDGDHEVGDEIDFPRDTPEQQVAFDTLVDYQILSTRKINKDKADPESPYVQPQG